MENKIDQSQFQDKIGKLKKICKLGGGTYGTVFKYQNMETNKYYALKFINLSSHDEGIPSTAIREISLLKELQHPNIIKLFNVIHQQKWLILVLEYVDMDLKGFLSTRSKELDTLVIKSLLFQLIHGIAFCHKKKILHRDLKPQNILLSNEGIIKLADFGLARAFGIPVRNYTNEVVTLWYRAPDVLLGSKDYSTAIDIWSIGCIFIELFTFKPVFKGQNQQNQLETIFKILGTPNSKDWQQLLNLPKWKEYQQYQKEVFQPIDIGKIVPKLEENGVELLQQMLMLNPKKRITGSDALKHPYFNDLPKILRQLYN